MTARGVQFQFLGMDAAPEPRPEPRPPHRCEVCGRLGSFLYRPPGFAGFQETPRARCFEHSHLGNNNKE